MFKRCVCYVYKQMSQMAMSTSRSSVFTFESTVHSSHVLHRLDEQRCRDTLCDVTVMVEGQSFRAHRSVLSSCSEYFSLRISSLMQHGAVVTLPPEVRHHLKVLQKYITFLPHSCENAEKMVFSLNICCIKL